MFFSPANTQKDEESASLILGEKQALQERLNQEIDFLKRTLVFLRNNEMSLGEYVPFLINKFQKTIEMVNEYKRLFGINSWLLEESIDYSIREAEKIYKKAYEDFSKTVGKLFYDLFDIRATFQSIFDLIQQAAAQKEGGNVGVTEGILAYLSALDKLITKVMDAALSRPDPNIDHIFSFR